MSACLLLATTACAHLPRDAVTIGEGLVFHLLPPASFGEHVILTQLVTIQYLQQREARHAPQIGRRSV